MRDSLRNVRFFRFSSLFISLLAILFSGCWDNSSETPVGTTTQVVFISDIHFSPFYDETIFNDLVKAGVDQWAGIFKGSGQFSRLRHDAPMFPLTHKLNRAINPPIKSKFL